MKYFYFLSGHFTRAVYKANRYLKFGITLVLHECGMPWDVLRAARRQLRVEIGMRGAVNRLACDLAVRLALVCVNESRGGRVRRRSTTNHCFFLWRT